VIGVPRPFGVTGAMMATSTTRRLVPAASCTACLTAGAAVLRSAQIVPGVQPGSPCARASRASAALLTLNTRSAPWQADAASGLSMTPSGAVTRGSYPRTTTPDWTRPLAKWPPASPRPSTATTYQSLFCSGPPRMAWASRQADGVEAAQRLNDARDVAAHGLLGRLGGARTDRFDNAFMLR